MRQNLEHQSIYYQYDVLSDMYNIFDGRKRNKNVILPKIKSSIFKKTSHYNAIMIFKSLPIELKK